MENLRVFKKGALFKKSNILSSNKGLKDKIDEYNVQINHKLQPTEDLRNMGLNELSEKISSSSKESMYQPEHKRTPNLK